MEFVSPESTISPPFSSAIAIVSPSSPIVVVSGGKVAEKRFTTFALNPSQNRTRTGFFNLSPDNLTGNSKPVVNRSRNLRNPNRVYYLSPNNATEKPKFINQKKPRSNRRLGVLLELREKSRQVLS